MDIGIIGGADGPTSVFVLSGGTAWYNSYGILLIFLILIPNILYAFRPVKVSKPCSSKAANLLEQIGRYGCMILMIFTPWTADSSPLAFLIYLLGNGILTLAYWIFWIPFYRKGRKTSVVWLALLPAGIFLLSAITLRSWLLGIFSVLFGVSHLYVTLQSFE